MREMTRQGSDRRAAKGEPFVLRFRVSRQASQAAERDVKPGLIINAARAALTGQSVGPSAFAVFVALGRERAVKRLKQV